MITKDALYDFTEDLITNAVDGDALFEAESFRNLRGKISEAAKTVRIEILDGVMAQTSEDMRKEQLVRFTAQFWKLPATVELSDLDDATDVSFEMAREFFDAMCDNPTLSGAVCDCYIDVFETGSGNVGSTVMGVTYLDGMINRAS